MARYNTLFHINILSFLGSAKSAIIRAIILFKECFLWQIRNLKLALKRLLKQ